MEKHEYEKPEVTKVDFSFEDVIAASGCQTVFSEVTSCQAKEI